MLETIIAVLCVFWLFGYFGPAVFPVIPQTGGLLHLLIAVAVILLIVRSNGDVAETSVALRKLLEAKDAAVRAAL